MFKSFAIGVMVFSLLAVVIISVLMVFNPTPPVGITIIAAILFVLVLGISLYKPVGYFSVSECSDKESSKKNTNKEISYDLYIQSNWKKIILFNKNTLTKTREGLVLGELKHDIVRTFHDFDEVMAMNDSKKRMPYVSSCFSKEPLVDFVFERILDDLPTEIWSYYLDTREEIRDILNGHLDTFLFGFCIPDEDMLFIKSFILFRFGHGDKRIEIIDFGIDTASKIGNNLFYKKPLESLMDDLIEFCKKTEVESIEFTTVIHDKEGEEIKNIFNEKLPDGVKFKKLSETHIAYL